MSEDPVDESRARLIAAIEAEFARILAEDHGMEGVSVQLDRETGAGTLSGGGVIPDQLMQAVMPIAAKRAIVRLVREQEREDE